MSSHRALALGIQKTLRDAFADPDGKRIGIAPPNLQPPAVAGQWYVAIGQENSVRGPSNSGDLIDEVYTVQIVVTAKTAYVPYDRLGWETHGPAGATQIAAAAAVSNPGLQPSATSVANKVHALLMEQYPVINNANLFVPGFNSLIDGFIEPFHRVSVSGVSDKPPSWVFSDAKNARPGELSFVTVTAEGARRLRTLGSVL